MTSTTYDRAVLVDVLIYHYRKDITACGCGWAELGRSWPVHVATVYEESVAARGPSRADCLIAADAVEGAIHVVDDHESAEALARLVDQWRADATTTFRCSRGHLVPCPEHDREGCAPTDLTTSAPDRAADVVGTTHPHPPAPGSHP